MGRHSKAKQTRIQNLRCAQKAQKPYIEDVTDLEDDHIDQGPPQDPFGDLLEHGFFLLDEDLGSDSDSDEEDEFYTADETNSETPPSEESLLVFSRMLQEAQLAAAKLEHEAKSEKTSRKRHYTGNAPRTKRYHAAKRRKLAESGQKFIQNFFTKKNTVDPPCSHVGNHRDVQDTTAEEIDESSDEEADVDVADNAEEYMRRLFPEDKETLVSFICAI